MSIVVFTVGNKAYNVETVQTVDFKITENSIERNNPHEEGTRILAPIFEMKITHKRQRGFLGWLHKAKTEVCFPDLYNLITVHNVLGTNLVLSKDILIDMLTNIHKEDTQQFLQGTKAILGCYTPPKKPEPEPVATNRRTRRKS